MATVSCPGSQAPRRKLARTTSATVRSYPFIRQPLKLTKNLEKFNIACRVTGGGLSGQAQAVRHGISRALLEFDPEMRGVLKRAGFLTRDSRVKERKKYGQRAARARFQYSKR